MSRRGLAAQVATTLVALGALFGGAVALFGDAAVARAQAQTGEVLIVLASEQPGPVDSRLAQEPALRQPPFNSYRSMRLLEQHPVTLPINQPTVVPLPNGRNLQIVLVRMMPNGRLQVRVSINRPGKTDYLQGVTVETSAGVPFFIAGQAYLGGTLVIGVRVGLRAPQPGMRVGPIGPRPPLGLQPQGTLRFAPPVTPVPPPPPPPPPSGAVRVTPPAPHVAVPVAHPPGTVQVRPGGAGH